MIFSSTQTDPSTGSPVPGTSQNKVWALESIIKKLQLNRLRDQQRQVIRLLGPISKPVNILDNDVDQFLRRAMSLLGNNLFQPGQTIHLIITRPDSIGHSIAVADQDIS